MTHIRLCLVEDHPEAREALLKCFSDINGLDIVAVCTDLPAALDALHRQRPNLLLVDLGLPSGSGLILIRRARNLLGPTCVCAVLTVVGNEEHLLTAIEAGASGHLYKTEMPAVWAEHILNLADGRSPMHSKIARYVLRNDSQRLEATPKRLSEDDRKLLNLIAAGFDAAELSFQLGVTIREIGLHLRAIYQSLLLPLPSLSPRELELLELLNKGFSFKVCSSAMGISESTAKTLAARAYQKLGVTSLQAALYEMRQNGLIL